MSQKTTAPSSSPASSTEPAADFVPPHPGSRNMPRWTGGLLPEAPVFTARNWFAMLGPGLVMGASAIGGGEWLAGPAVTAKYGGSLLWVATLSILIQVLYNIEISRYTLYSGEPIFTGKFRIPPGPALWLIVYLMLDWGSVAPYLAVNAAIPLEAVILGRLPQPDTIASDWWMHKLTATCIYTAAMLPMIFGGKIYNALKVVMSFKLVTVVGFLLLLGLLFSHPSSWWEINSGFVKFGTVPVFAGEDLNGNGVLDPGEDFDSDGHMDVVEPVLERNAAGAVVRYEDLDGDGKWDGVNTENIFLSLWRNGELPRVDWSLIAMIAGLAAIAGNGGLTNTPISNFTRDQGWGMGSHVGAIPSVVGGHGITLSHVGCVFDVNERSLPRWRRWYRHVARDQLCVWLVACLIGVALPSILSVEFLPRGTGSDDWTTAAMTAGGVQEHVTAPPPGVLAHSPWISSWLPGPKLGRTFWAATLLCGFLVLGTSMASTMDGFVRRWVDVIWTASPRMRELDTSYIRYVYFSVLVVYCVCGYTIMWLTEKPGFVFKIATTGYNFAFAFSCWHTVFVNSMLLPRPLRPAWWIRIAMMLAGGVFFSFGVVAAASQLGWLPK